MGGIISGSAIGRPAKSAQMPLLLTHPVLFFGGKGGVGKTTCSAAYALARSRHGDRVLLVSTDPAHSTADVFAARIGPVETELQPNLFAVELDPDAEASRYIEQVKRDVDRIFSHGVARQARRQIDLAAASPGVAEVALLDRIIDLIVDRQGAYDLVVFDTAPTGHTLQLLRMPDAMTTWVGALVKHRRAMLEIDRGGEQAEAVERDPVVIALERRRQRLDALGRCLLDRRRTAFVLVTIAERLAIEETARAQVQLEATGVNVGAIVVNRLLPDGLTGEFYEARKAQELEYRREIDERFSRFARVPVVQLPRDVHGTDALGLVSAQLVAPGVPPPIRARVARGT